MEGIQVSTLNAGSHNQISIIKVGGYIDTTTSAEVERSLNALLKQGRYQIIIDLGAVDYISSAGWGIFISEIKSIRENNGDLKLVQMIPDVYEIFELLEFHHILDVYDSVQEAVNKFEESQYVEVVSESRVKAQPKEAAPKPVTNTAPTAQTPPTPRYENREQAATAAAPKLPNLPNSAATAATEEPRKQSIIDTATLPVEEKVKHIVRQNPEFGAYKINKRLNTPDYGFARIGWFGVRSLLSQLGLNSRGKRREFAQKSR